MHGGSIIAGGGLSRKKSGTEVRDSQKFHRHILRAAVNPSPAPAISVVVPLYNKERSVTRCLQSILAQSLPPAEIIVVNDGSTDASVAAVKKFSDPRLRLLEQPNGGVSAARNTGFTAAQNEFIALLDADDEWHPDFLSTMVQLAKKFPGAGLFYAAHHNHRAGKIISTAVPTLPPAVETLVNIFEFNTDEGPWSSAVMLRKSFLPRTGTFDPKLVKGEDIDLWIRFALAGPVALHNAPLSTCHADAENRAMQRPCPPERTLVGNLGRFAEAARVRPDFYQYLQQMRVAHICNFLGGNPCELADPHAVIDGLDLNGLPPMWKVIRRTPRSLRRTVFRILLRAGGLKRHLKKVPAK